MPLPSILPQSMKVLGYQQLAAGAVDASTGLAVPDGTEVAEVAVGAQAIRWRADGVAPTAAVGQPVPAGATVVFQIQQLPALRFISQVAGASLDATFYGR